MTGPVVQKRKACHMNESRFQFDRGATMAARISREARMKRIGIAAALVLLLMWTARAQADEPLTDGQMLGVVFVANQAEIAAGNLALRRTRSYSLKVFANRLISEHGQVNQEIAALTQRTGAQPQRSPTSDALA